jgi:hypothetical protein
MAKRPQATRKPAARVAAARSGVPTLEKRICDIAERAMLGRFRVERTELISKIVERLVIDALEADPRFHSTAAGLFWQLTAAREEAELARRRQEEATAEAAAGTVTEPERLPAGPGRYYPVGGGEPPPLDDEELGAEELAAVRT